jgi:hypothetical protein
MQWRLQIEHQKRQHDDEDAVAEEFEPMLIHTAPAAPIRGFA